MNSKNIRVEVIYALPTQQDLVILQLPEHSTVRDAIEKSGLLEKYPEIDLKTNKLGVFGKLSKLDTVVRERDRVEIYRSLIADPKAVRKQRAEGGKVMKKGASESGDEA